MAKNVGNFDFPENIVNRVKAMIVDDVVVLKVCWNNLWVRDVEFYLFSRPEVNPLLIMSKRRLDIDGGSAKKQREDEGGLKPGMKMNDDGAAEGSLDGRRRDPNQQQNTDFVDCYQSYTVPDSQ